MFQDHVIVKEIAFFISSRLNDQSLAYLGISTNFSCAKSSCHHVLLSPLVRYRTNGIEYELFDAIDR